MSEHIPVLLNEVLNFLDPSDGKIYFDGTFGGKVYPDFNPDLLFDALGIEPNWEKIRYWILLDELF